jgi:hypothetical protein
MDDIDRALSDLRQAVLGLRLRKSELSNSGDARNPQLPGVEDFRPKADGLIDLELRRRGPSTSAADFFGSTESNQSQATRESQWTADVDPRPNTGDSIREPIRSEVDKLKLLQSARKLLGRFTQTVRSWVS